MKNSLCVIHELADLMTRNESLKAVWLDAEKRKVSFASQPGARNEHTRQALQEVISAFRPDEIPGCTQEPWRVECELCERGRNQPMPKGIRLIALPGSGVLLQKESCDTAPRFWRWHQFPWLKLKPKEIEIEPMQEWRRPLALAVLCGLATLAAFVMERWIFMEINAVVLSAYLLAYLSGSYYAVLDVWSLLKKRVLDVHFLMLTVAAGAALIGHWWEGAILMFLFSISGAMEDYAMGRTERAIKSLFTIAPREVTLLDDDGHEQRVSVDSLQPGMKLRVRPGDLFPVDVEIIDGASAADESNLTGESIPVDKSVGDKALAGTINLWGRLDCVVIKSAAESSLARIIRLIREARESKAPSQRFTDRFGSAYTYAVLGVSAVMFLVWWQALNLPIERAFYRTMTLLVVSSPCALVLSIPSAILAGIAAGARRGILFRGGSAIERLAEIHRVALDKTGTLTTGQLHVLAIHSTPGGRETEVLTAAAALGQHSSHPVSIAITRMARERKLTLPLVQNFRALTGLGVSGTLEWNGGHRETRLGRRSLFQPSGWLQDLPEPEVGITEAVLESDDLRGRVLLRDEVRTASRPLLQALTQSGLRLTMLSGDRPEAARSVSDHVGLEEVLAGLDPHDKVDQIKAWSQAGENVAMIGDGVNDAPSLAAAHVGVAMGMRGADAALEQADVVLTQDKLERFYDAYEISRKARRIIRQNLAVSLGSVAILVVAAFFGLIPLTVAVIGHEGSTVIVVLNSLRLLISDHEE